MASLCRQSYHVGHLVPVILGASDFVSRFARRIMSHIPSSSSSVHTCIVSLPKRHPDSCNLVVGICD